VGGRKRERGKGRSWGKEREMIHILNAHINERNFKKEGVSWVSWCTPVVLAPRRQKETDRDFRTT
jgi:hypothetical protein